MARFLQHDPPTPPEWGMKEMRGAAGRCFVPVAERPTKKMHDRNIDNFFAVTLRDSGEVALIDGDTKEIGQHAEDRLRGAHLAHVAFRRYVYTIGRDAKIDLIDLWMPAGQSSPRSRSASRRARSRPAKYKGYEDKYAIAGAYWPPQYVIMDGPTLEPLKIVSTRGMTVDTQEYHPEPRVAAIVASHEHPEFIVNVKETGRILLVNYEDIDNLSITTLGRRALPA
jgi:nitrite reductase (NO-forming)/hydroxylamine reductase